MKKIIFFISIIMVALSLASDVEDTIAPLSVSDTTFKDIWHGGYRDASWSLSVSGDVVNNTDLLLYKGLQAKLFKSHNTNKSIVVQAGPICDALNQYYFDKKVNNSIKEFVRMDKVFINKYGFSVIDAIFIKGVQFSSWNGEKKAFYYRYAQGLAEKGLFTLTQKQSEFNGKPSTSISLERTQLGDTLFKQVYQ